MRLLNTRNFPELKEIFDEDKIPPYAILSHTWEDEEVSFQQLSDPVSCVPKNGYRKIQQACALAAEHGFGSCWVDTCCINKEATAELSESINMMYRWYEKAAVCYAYLADLAPNEELRAYLPRSKWFTRGWTLQELIAPPQVMFFDREWNYRGSRSGLAKDIASIAGIPERLLLKETHPSAYSVAARMSWVSRRETTRIEDMAYCLLGIFDVNMPLIYGERSKAFLRLQDAIIQSIGDLSIFAWTSDTKDCPEFSGFFAQSPQQFSNCSNMEAIEEDPINQNLTITTRGIQLSASLVHLYQGEESNEHHQPVLPLSWLDDSPVAIYLRKIGPNRFARWRPDLLTRFDPGPMGPPVFGIPRYGQVTELTASLTHTYYDLPVETVVLPPVLPEFFPFHPSNPVLGNRLSALRVSQNTMDNLPLTGERHVFYPRSHWDRHDAVFFCTSSSNDSWCATTVKFLSTHNTDGKRVRNNQVELFAACFYWNDSVPYRPLTMLADLTKLSPEAAYDFEFHLGRVKSENVEEAWRLILKTFCDSIAFKQNDVDIHVGLDVMANARLNLCLGVPCPDICVRPISCLDITLSRVDYLETI
ncbi:heterokaryon incompatibility protein-domain-containing protein [Cercophora newfieldiana]|uniref:Heterokaryon incompatibility protein-domain-containing protein n=1 Tax=Cercophora newfieldiana TaxID=92897 RepID=A0AA39YBP2_9PEZI|nr:heterokaryon incompatibility protein-domain-containing protein [Cercophora newfieldiana]